METLHFSPNKKISTGGKPQLLPTQLVLLSLSHLELCCSGNEGRSVVFCVTFERTDEPLPAGLGRWDTRASQRLKQRRTRGLLLQVVSEAEVLVKMKRRGKNMHKQHGFLI